MKTRKDICGWIVEALNASKGSAKVRDVANYVWEHHGEEIRSSGELHFTWHEDIFWAATQLRAQGILKNAKATSKMVWELA